MQRDEARKQNQEIKQASMLYLLDPFLDKEGILRVGGRIRQASRHEDIKNPVILPKKGHVTELLTTDFHEKAHHKGRGFTLNEICSNGCWIIGCSGAVSSLIKNCGHLPAITSKGPRAENGRPSQRTSGTVSSFYLLQHRPVRAMLCERRS